MTDKAQGTITLPNPKTTDGDTRQLGVEIEFGGLKEEAVADIVADCFGGKTIPRDDKGLIIEDTEIGDIEVYLDSQYLHQAESSFDQKLLDIARKFVPLELVTSPFPHTALGKLDVIVDRLKQAGAVGTDGGLLLGYGVHFNPEVEALTLEKILPVLTAYALCEDALRDAADIDLSRRALPFVDPYPRALVDALAEREFGSMEELIDCYLELAPSRNYGLDMMCIFAMIDKDRVAAKMDMATISARPTYHFRLPDCRIDQDDWSLELDWQRWVKIEKVARDADLLEDLKEAWKEHRASLTSIRSDWRKESSKLAGDF